MKILFFMAHAGYTRNFESTLRLLGQEGHAVTLVFDRQKENAGGADDIVVALERDFPNIQTARAPQRSKADPRLLVGQQLRVVLDWMRYLAPEFRDTEKLRERAGSRVPKPVRAVLALPGVRSRAVRMLISAFLRGAERSVPPRQEVVDFIDELKPDLVLVTPLLEVGSPQHEYLRAARATGRRTGLCVASWDNLTTAGLVHEVPDLITVWNEPQREEAGALHGIPAARVVVTGACAYDHWFDWEPATTREEFCTRAGIRADRPYVLYLCSSGFITPNEGEFVLRWVKEMRGALPPELAETGIVVRPHPTNPMSGKESEHDAAAQLTQLPNVAVWPESAMNPTNRAAREMYFDSIYHAAVVVGVNTSAQIESAIVGRRVLTVFAPEYRGTQEGTLHYHHLLSVNGGLLERAESWEQHVEQLTAALRLDADARGSAQGFLEGFVRPFGLDDPATPRMLAAFESAAALPAPPAVGLPAYAMLYRPFLALAFAAVARFNERGKKARSKPQKARRKVAVAAVAAGDRRRQWNPLTWPLALARGFLAAALTVPFFRGFLYRHVRPALLSAVVLIERAARPGGPSRALREAQGDQVPVRGKKKRDPAKAAPVRPAPRTKKAPKASADNLDQHFGAVVRGSQQVVAGPWLGGVASETAIWIPFLRYLTAQWPGLSNRLVAVSRGGVSAWYAHLAGRYVDISELYDIPSNLVLENAARLVDGRADDRLVAAVGEGIRTLLGGRDVTVLDPRQVVPAILTANSGRMPFRYAPLDAATNRPAWLPDRYVAASFATADAFPRTPDNRRAALLAVERAAATAAVVLIADDHGILDGAPEQLRAEIVVPSPAELRRDALAARAAVLAHARSVIGSLDGSVAAAAAQGSRVVSLCSDPAAFDKARLDLIREAAAGAGGELAVLQTAEVDAHFAAPLAAGEAEDAPAVGAVTERAAVGR